MSECQRVGSLIPTLLDGELDAGSSTLLRDHLEVCAVCQEKHQFELSLRQTLKKVVHTYAPQTLRAQILLRMQAERAALQTSQTGEAAKEEAAAAAVREAEVVMLPAHRQRTHSASWTRKLSSVGVWAAAAGLLLFFGIQRLSQVAHQNTARRSFPGPLGDILVEHSRPLPPESRSADDVRKFGTLVGVPVNPLALRNARLVGGRVLPVNRERAAMLQYEVDHESGPAKRVSVFIYDPKKIQIEDSDLEPRAVGTAQVRMGKANGYSLAVTEREGVGIVMAGDSDTDLGTDMLQ
jgi:mycothiol system anti-sigma-R factor